MPGPTALRRHSRTAEDSPVPPALSVSAAGPWFRRRPAATVAVAGTLYVAITALRFAMGDPNDTVSLLFALPTALVAVAFGRRAGIAGGAVAIGLLASWVATTGAELSPVGWASRAVPLLLLGWLLGDAMDRLQVAETRRAELEQAAQRHRDAVEINDSIVQGMAAAKWALEAGQLETGLARLTETLQSSRRLVSDLLRDADMAPDGRRGHDTSGRAVPASVTER